MLYVDMHCHCHELGLDYLENYRGVLKIVCVSDDPDSSLATVMLAEKLDVIPCIGIHPWEAHLFSEKDVESLARLISERGVKCLGEVGLDKKFYPHTLDHQLKLFTKFLELGREHDLVFNLHTAGAWSEVLELLIRNDIGKAYFHWYTGPLELLDQIIEAGYYIGINPAWKIQEKHRLVIEKTPLSSIITESDAPYRYRGLDMKPELVIETTEYIARVKNTEPSIVKSTVYSNLRKLLVLGNS